MEQHLYAQDGVNVAEGDSFSKFAGAICKRTYHNSPFVEVQDFADGFFRGPRCFRFVNLPAGYLLDAAPDGIGTKTVVVNAAFTYKQAAHDVIAMTAGDITRWGGKPLIFVNVLDVATLGDSGSATNLAFRDVMRGLGDVAQQQGFVCFKGETAELGALVGNENPEAITSFNWAGFMLGVFLPDRIVTGKTLGPGQTVVALQESGFRSNGYSAVRKALRLKFGELWWKKYSGNKWEASCIQDAARPATLYDKFLTEMNGWEYPIRKPHFKFHLLTHVTGGGIVGKFAEDMLFPRGLSAELNNLFDPPEIMRNVVEWRGMSEEEAYRTFNCGNGMLVVLDRDEVAGFVSAAEEHGISAQACGFVTETPRGEAPALRIRSGYSDTVLTFTSK